MKITAQYVSSIRSKERKTGSGTASSKGLGGEGKLARLVKKTGVARAQDLLDFSVPTRASSTRACAHLRTSETARSAVESKQYYFSWT